MVFSMIASCSALVKAVPRKSSGPVPLSQRLTEEPSHVIAAQMSSLSLYTFASRFLSDNRNASLPFIDNTRHLMGSV